MNKDDFYNKKEEEEYLYVSDDEDEFTEQQDNNLLFKHLLDLNEIAGFLLLDRTYGRKGKKLLYKVQPYNRSYPCLLIPFENKIEFSKEVLNKYILFKYDNFNNKPITGLLVRNLGNVNCLQSYYLYEMYGKNIKNYNNIMNKELKIAMSNETYLSIYHSFETLDNEYIFSIDNENTEYYDDAISIKKFDNKKIVNVYISNVAILIDEFNLWDFICDITSTVYLPNHRDDMLPFNLIKMLSLKENSQKIVIRIEYTINETVDVKYYISIIEVNKNYVYDSNELKNNSYYKDLLQVTKEMDPSVENSMDVIKYWMVLTNSKIGELFCEKKIGIHKYNIDYDDPNYEEIKKDYNYYNINYQVKYAQITSPIRRKVDIYNQMLLMDKILNYEFKKSIDYNKLLYDNIDVWSDKMKSISRISNMCKLLENFDDNNYILIMKGEKKRLRIKG